MKSVRSNPLFVAIALLIIVVAVFAIAGSYVRATVLETTANEEHTRAARGATSDMLIAQIDEETAVRGYALTHDPLFLQPYHAALKRYDPLVARLRRELDSINWPDRGPIVDSLVSTNAQWKQTVALPLFAKSPPRNMNAILRRGKIVADQYRTIEGDLNEDLVERRNLADAEIRDSINHVGSFVVGAIIVVLLLAVAFAIQQRNLRRRLEDERRTAAAAQAAYTTEKRISDTLQEAFMLKPLPNVPNVSLSGIYVPATEDTRVGGDWYDVVELDDTRVMFAVGDVAGHGLAAAVAMNQTRQSLLTAALGTRDLAELLARVNGELIRSDGRMVTAVCGYADAHTYTFTYATAGHPPPILLEPGRGARLLEFGGVPLGVVDGAQYQSYSVQTVPGAMLVLYTDGAVEHSHDILEGEKTLLRAVNDAPADDSDPSKFIRDTIFANLHPADDVAIVTITFAQGKRNAGRENIEELKLSAAGPGSSPGAVTSIGPRALLRHSLRSQDRRAS